MEKEREVRLRRRIEEMVRARVGVLEQDISKLQKDVNESFNHLLEQTEVAAGMADADEAFSQLACSMRPLVTVTARRTSGRVAQAWPAIILLGVASSAVSPSIVAVSGRLGVEERVNVRLKQA